MIKQIEKKLEESKKPNNAAISLAGEPMFYPDINDLIAEFKKNRILQHF